MACVPPISGVFWETTTEQKSFKQIGKKILIKIIFFSSFCVFSLFYLFIYLFIYLCQNKGGARAPPLDPPLLSWNCSAMRALESRGNYGVNAVLLYVLHGTKKFRAKAGKLLFLSLK